MDYRLGTCSSCNAAFRVPATFKADKAKCKSCGGVVEIGPVQSSGQSGGARKSEAPKVAPPVPAKKPQPVPARKPTPKPAAPQAKTPAKPAAPAAGRPARKPDSVRSAAEQAADRIRNAGTRKSPAPAEAEPAGAPASGSRGKSKGSSRARRRAPEKKKKSLAPAFIGLGVLALMAAGGFFFWKRDSGSETQAAETAKVDTAPVEPANGTEEPTDAPIEAAPVETPEPEPEESEPVKKKATADPDSVDLSLLEVQDKLPETSDEDFTEMKQLMATFIDPAAGAAGGRARKKLEAKGKEAFPVIMNAFINIDVGTEQGRKNGDLVQRLLMDMCRGNNFDWKYTLEPEDVYFNKKVIVAWHYNWMLAREDPVKWAKLAKLTDEEAEAIGGKKEPELDDF